MTITANEMRGILKGKCLPGDLRVNEEIPDYLVRKFAMQAARIAELESGYDEQVTEKTRLALAMVTQQKRAEAAENKLVEAAKSMAIGSAEWTRNYRALRQAESRAEAAEKELRRRREQAAPVAVPDEIKQILLELRAYNPKADDYGGKHIIPGWADRIEKALRLNSGSKSDDSKSLVRQ